MGLSVCPPKPRESLLHNYTTPNAMMLYGSFSYKNVDFFILNFKDIFTLMINDYIHTLFNSLMCDLVG